MSELPKGWAIAHLEELSESIRNGVFVSRPAEAPPGEPILRISAVRPMLLDSTDVRYARQMPTNADSARLSVGDLVFTRYSGTRDFVGACAVVGEDSAGLLHPDKLIRVVPNGPLVSAHYLAAFCSSPLGRQWLEAAMKTTAGQTGLAGSDLKRLPVRLAPRQEQERIVSAIEEAFSKLDAGETGLRRVRQLLKRMRDFVLAAAVAGRLVPQDPSDTPAASLLADLAVASGGGPKDGWATVRLGDVARIGSGTTPRRGESRYWNNGTIPWVTSGLVTKGVIREAQEFVTERALRETSLRVWPSATLLVAMYGEGQTRGRCAELGIDAACNQACAAISLLKPLQLYKDFVRISFDANYMANRRLGGGGVQPNLNAGLIRDMVLPLPPPEEQARIVGEVERQVSFIEACELAVDVGLARSAGLRRSVLKAAFEGRLVAPDPSDEPASTMLERIRAERSATPAAKQRARQRT